ncbi:imidazole glycerol phosphate synthase subunit HisH [Thalassotalea sp. M1531]|uniref:Imidazole glycerol phosphate synthase subunit HisH n=1 Tax=Thalassotalea algicola TaxID=2716224 RepID=A0A7Y0Q6M2_9GAMM|nr:imidazole glycerol phosphate synthase subunit HisH [Thalassotalea algicola]NMP31326.1 imidazole glycerol phosphate synthase subunit HisH [Thalassotalea algicola]
MTENVSNVIIDTGCANLSSVLFAIKRLGYDVIISDDIATIQTAKKVILPGVGNAKHAMKNIEEKGLVECIQGLKQPVLGFCLGMQLMCSDSLESTVGQDSELINCLDLIPTSVKPLASKGLRLPHMGWNTLTSIIDHPVFANVNVGDYFYFVHSFAAPINEFTAASCDYGSEFSAAVVRENFIGCQFHPERSGVNGSKIIKNFLEM